MQCIDMHKTKTFMVAIMLALALALATVGFGQHVMAYDYSDPCAGKFYYPCDHEGHNGYAYQQPSTYSNVDYGGIWVTPSGFSCWGEWRCASGWNHAIVDAPRDYANNNYDPSCNDHTLAYCNGYTQGYVYAWNIEVNNQNPSQSQQTIQQQGCTIIGSPGSTCTQTEQSAQGQNQ